MLKELFGERVPASLEHDPATCTLRLKPEQALTPGMRYTVTLAGVTDRSGNTLKEPMSWSFPPGLEMPGETGDASTNASDLR